jgi:hypothetical protein
MSRAPDSQIPDSRTPDPEASRADRLAAALRENLRRRKAQAKGRVAEERSAVAGTTPAGDSADPAVAGEAGRVAGSSDKR